MRKQTKLHVCPTGGIGDVLLVTPIIRMLKQNNPHQKLVVHVNRKDHADVFLNNPNIDTLRLETKATQAIAKFLIHNGLFKMKITFTDYGRDLPSLFFDNGDRHAITLIARLFEVPPPQKIIEIFLSKAEEGIARELLAPYPKPVIVHNTAVFSKLKEWPVDKWEALVRRNPNITFIQIGKIDDRPITGCVDLRNKTSLRLSFSLIREARSFIGIDSAMSHVTNAFGVPGVVLFGPSDPEIWGHSNNINLYGHLRCSPCIAFMGAGGQCRYSHQCMNEIQVSQVEHALHQQLSRDIDCVVTARKSPDSCSGSQS